MIPILLVSDDEKKAQKYIDELVKTQKVQGAYVLSIRKETTQLKIDQIRELTVQMRSFGSALAIACIFDFETAKMDAQNTLLKTLEESSPFTQFILIVSDESAVLPTIVSRTKIVRLAKKIAKESDFDFNKELGDLLLEYDGMQKNAGKAVKFCDEVLGYFQRMLHTQATKKEPTQGIILIIDEILKTRSLIVKNNVNPQLSIDHLLIFIRRTFQ